MFVQKLVGFFGTHCWLLSFFFFSQWDTSQISLKSVILGLTNCSSFFTPWSATQRKIGCSSSDPL